MREWLRRLQQSETTILIHCPMASLTTTVVEGKILLVDETGLVLQREGTGDNIGIPYSAILTVSVSQP